MFVLPMSHSAHRRALRAAAFPRAFAHLFDAGVCGAAADAGDSDVRVPRMDVRETDAAYTLYFDMPGATKEQLKVSVEGRRVSVETVAIATGEAPATEASADTPRLLYRERREPRFARTVSLPAEVDQSASQARFEHGVLTLTLAKRVPNGATQISIS
jgi:HSP20 family protein